ncbi:protein G12-like [Nomia melanderi]|uniref:protein G12-like n=1 Tax=Nomia melanderi TaxID=2448451 RepID=UPI003FCDA88A
MWHQVPPRFNGERFNRPKMKFAVVALAILAVASPLNAYKIPATGSGELAKDMQDILDLIPLDKVVSVVRAYIAQDKQVQALLKIATSADSVAYIKELESYPEFKEIADFVQKRGLDIYLCINELNKSLNLGPFVAYTSYKITGGIAGLKKDLLDLLPAEEILRVAQDKMENSKVVKELIEEVTSPKYKALYNLMINSSNVRKLLSASERAGIAREDFQVGYMVVLTAHVIRSLH